MRLLGLIILLLTLCTEISYAQQSRSDLEKRRQAIIESLKETQAQLEATKKDKRATMSQLNALQAKLNAREKLINNINLELQNLDKDIQTSAQEVQVLRNNLQKQQLRYAQSVRYAYANRSSHNAIAFVFSAKNFNDALRRMKYLKKYRDFRKGQVEEIKTTQGKIVEKISVLSTVKNQKGQLLTAEQQQKLVLQQEKSETAKIVEELKGREKDLAADIENKRKITKRLDNAISEAIRKEIEIARKKAEEEERKRRLEEERKAAALAAAKAAEVNNANTYGNGPNKVTLPGGGKYDVPTPSTANKNNTANTSTVSNTNNKPIAANTGNSGSFSPVAATVNRNTVASVARSKPSYTPSLTPEAAELSNNFESNRGKLPWPVASGVVIDEFGKHKHAVATKVEIENYGIDIQTNQGAKARAVFDGKVTTVMGLQGSGQTVIINHGNFFTVYSGLTGVTVKVGDQVTVKQPIGTVSNNEDGVAVMNFQVWKGANKMNPSTWIAPM